MTHARNQPSTRETPIDPDHAALLVIDVQNYCARRGEGELAGVGPEYDYYIERVERLVLPNLQKLIRASRANGVEVARPCDTNLSRRRASPDTPM